MVNAPHAPAAQTTGYAPLPLDDRLEPIDDSVPSPPETLKGSVALKGGLHI